MIKDIIQILNSDGFYGVSDRVEIAKGKWAIPTTFKDGFHKIKRLWLIRKSK